MTRKNSNTFLSNLIFKIKSIFAFSLTDLLDNYNIPKKNCLHVGANIGSEIEIYEKYGFENVIWIEGYKPYFDILKKNIKDKENHHAFNVMVSEIQNEKVNFKIASNTGSSTIFEPTDEWYETFSDLSFTKTEIINCSRIDNLLSENFEKDFSSQIKFIVLDVEGAELKALFSLGTLIQDIEFAFVEVSLRQNFKNAPLMIDIDRYFFNNSFKKVFLKYGAASGDALYMKVKKVSNVHKYKTYFIDTVIQFMAKIKITDQIVKIKMQIKKIIK